MFKKLLTALILLVCIDFLSAMEEKPAKKRKIDIEQFYEYYLYCTSSSDDKYSDDNLNSFFCAAVRNSDINTIEYVLETYDREWKHTIDEAVGVAFKQSNEAMLLHMLLRSGDLRLIDLEAHSSFVKKCEWISSSLVNAYYKTHYWYGEGDIHFGGEHFWKNLAQRSYSKFLKHENRDVNIALMVSSLWQTIALYRYFEFEGMWEGKVEDIYENFDGCYEVVKKSGFLKEFEKNLCCVE